MKNKLVHALLLLILVSGCGGVELPSLHQFSGTATYQGKPVTNAMIVFCSTKGGRPSYGTLDNQGKFEMIYSPHAKGVAVGENKISVIPNTPGPTDPPLSKDMQEFFESYNDQNSKMTLNVTKDEKDYSLQFK